MRILVMNVNTSESMTEVIGAAARRHASAGTETIALRRNRCRDAPPGR